MSLPASMRCARSLLNVSAAATLCGNRFCASQRDRGISFRRTQNDKLEVELHQLVEHLADQIESLLVRQARDDAITGTFSSKGSFIFSRSAFLFSTLSSMDFASYLTGMRLSAAGSHTV